MNKSAQNKNAQQLSKIASKCKDKKLVDSLITKFQDNAKTVVENIIQMAESVVEMHNKYTQEILNKNDLEYFCKSVKLERTGSQYRKYICIGKNAEMFRQRIETIPQSISVLYEMTTLDAEELENLFSADLIQPGLSLKQLKSLANKSPSRSTDSISIPISESTTLDNFDRLIDSETTTDLRSVVVMNSSIDSGDVDALGESVNSSNCLTIRYEINSLSEKSKQLIRNFYEASINQKDLVVVMPNDDAFSEVLRKLNS